MLIKLVLIVFGLYIFFRLFATYILPWIVKMAIKRFQKRFFEQNPNMKTRQESEKGKVSIRRVGEDTATNIPDDVGEYIDYEELNNNQTPPKDE